MVNAWHNEDGLYIKYGLSEGAAAVNGGQILDHGSPYRIVELDIDYTDVASASASILSDHIVIPANARIDKVEIVTTTAWDSAGDAFVFNLGLIKVDRATEIDYNGLVAALPQTSMDPAGDFQVIDVNHTYKGALIGTTTAYKGLITADYDTAAPTAGAAKVRIYYYRTA